MRKFLITETVPAADCVRNLYPNPETHPNEWLTAIRDNVAYQVQEHGRDLEWASDLMRIAIARANYVAPRPMSDIEHEILAELAA